MGADAVCLVWKFFYDRRISQPVAFDITQISHEISMSEEDVKDLCADLLRGGMIEEGKTINQTKGFIITSQGSLRYKTDCLGLSLEEAIRKS